MNRPKLLRALSFIWSLVFLTGMANAQVQVEGTVYDMTQQYPMRGVSVVSTGGRGTMTDSLGRYRIVVAAADSLYFSYLGRGTAKFPVKDLPPGYPFDMSLQVAVDTLPAATVWNPSYRLDSLENRKEYRKAFDYEGGMLHDMKMERRPGFGVGLDLDMLIDGKANRRMEALKSRLEWEEKDKYVDHHWNRAIVRKITGLEPPALDTFMRQYRPGYEFIRSCETEYEFYKYIQEWGRFFDEDWRIAHKDAARKDSTQRVGFKG